jgi:hypothetical protein
VAGNGLAAVPTSFLIGLLWAFVMLSNSTQYVLCVKTHIVYWDARAANATVEVDDGVGHRLAVMASLFFDMAQIPPGDTGVAAQKAMVANTFFIEDDL